MAGSATIWLMARTSTPRDVVAVAFHDFQILDVVGPLEVFSQANRILEDADRTPAYRVHVVALAGGPLLASSGLSLLAAPLRAAPDRYDTLVVSGGSGTREAAQNARLVDFIRQQPARARRITSVCSGALLLARAGLLDGRRATTHWGNCADLARFFPRVRVEPDRIFVKDGAFYTSAGVTAGIDLALALVAEDHGKKVALEVARQLVVFLQRPGGQSQFSAQMAAQAADSDPIAEVVSFVEDHLQTDLSVPVLARRAAMSPRHFARTFGAELGTTPARYVHTARLAAARRRLEESAHGLERIAEEAGFGTTETLRRAFVAELGITPSEYRSRFGAKGKST
jgi:transcriptional regulator GlxA family with amidase domain